MNILFSTLYIPAIVSKCHSDLTFRYKIISENMCDTSCEIVAYPVLQSALKPDIYP